jgi:hypothetical protein
VNLSGELASGSHTFDLYSVNNADSSIVPFVSSWLPAGPS